MNGELHRDQAPDDLTDPKRVEEVLKWSARRDELLSQTATRLLQSHDPQGVVEELCRAVMAFLDCHVFFNFLMDERAGRLRLNACAGIPEDEARKIEWLDYGVTACGCVARDRERIVAGDIQHTQDPRTALVRSYGVQAYCCHPLMAQDRLIGTLSFGTRSRPQFRAEEVEVMKTVTSLVAVAVQRIRTETALRESEERFRTVIENSRDGINMLDLETGRYIFMSPAQVELTGFTAEELQNLPVEEAYARVHPDDREISVSQQKEVAAGRDPVRIAEYRWKVKSGEYRWFSDSRKVVRDAQGRAVAMVGVSRDITDQKRAEEALRESLARRQVAEAMEAERRRLFDVLETLPAMVCLLTPDYHVAFANRSFRERFGEADGRHCYEFCFGRGEPCEFCETYTVLKTGQPHRWEVTAAVGSVIEAYDFPFTDVDGSPTILEMAVDVTERRKFDAELVRHREHLEVLVNERTTRLEALNAELQAEIAERKRAEESLRETHDYLQKLIDYANAPIIVWNPAFQITRFNHAFERLTGRRAGDVIGRELQILFPEATCEESMTHIRRTATGERWETLEIPIAHLDGRVHTVLWNSATLFDADGRTPIATIAQGQDITDRKRLEEDLRAIAANLADANRLKDEFLGTLSHELRTPLNAILGWAQMLLNRRLDPTQVRHALEVIDRNTKAQVKLVEDVLDVSRILSGKLRLAMHRINLAESVKAALDAIRPTADAKGVEIATAVARDAVLVGDPDRLQQICWNLLSNAVKFTPKGGRVDVRVRRMDSRIELRVQDTGVGIAPEFLPHLFERFRQADSSTTRQHGGLGLGLALVRHFVELHGGAVVAESAGPERGATFTVTLPVSAVAIPAAEPGAATIPGPASAAVGIAPALTGVRVLVVDDEADARDLLQHVLRGYGAEVEVADSVQAGLEAVQQWRPDVLLGDIGMPSEDGYELIRRIRALPPEHGGLTPAAALTAYGGTEDRLRALSAGYQQHVAKPVVPDELAALVSALAPGPRRH